MKSSYALILQEPTGPQWAYHTRHGEPHLEPFPLADGLDDLNTVVGADLVDQFIVARELKPVQMASMWLNGQHSNLWHPFHGEVNVRVETEERKVNQRKEELAFWMLGVYAHPDTPDDEPSENPLSFGDWLDTNPPAWLIATVVSEIHSNSKVSGAPDLGFLV